MNDLTLIQKEIAAALEQMKDKSLITEAAIAKKVRENGKIQGKNKAGLSLKDIEESLAYLAESKQLYFALHLNSANDILVKKADEFKLLDSEAKKRRLASEKSIFLLTNNDLKEKTSGGKAPKKRTDRKKLSFRKLEDYD